MSNNQFNTPIKQTALNEFKLRLYADPVSGSKKKPSLAVSVVKNQPRITVRTNVETDPENGRVMAKMDAPTFFGFLEVLRLAIDAEPGYRRSIENKNPFIGGKANFENPMTESTTHIGKDPEGRVFIGVVNKKVTPVRFYFKPTNFHYLVDQDGNAIPEAELTVIYAKAWLNLMYQLVPNVLDTHFEEPDTSNWNNNGGGQQRNNYGGGQQQQRPSKPANNNSGWNDDFADDIPM